MGCRYLLQGMKVKSESEVAQSCLTPSDPMDCSLPGSSVYGIFQARVLEWGAIAFSEHSLWRDGRDYHLSGFWRQREGQSRDDSLGRPLPIAQLCLISSLEKDGSWPQRTLWRRPYAKGLGHPLLKEARDRERES